MIVTTALATGPTAQPEVVCAWVTIAAEAIRQPEVRLRYQAAVGRLGAALADVVDDGTASHTWEPVRPTAEIVVAFAALVQGYFALSAAAPELVPDTSAVRTATILLNSMLGRIA